MPGIASHEISMEFTFPDNLKTGVDTFGCVVTVSTKFTPSRSSASIELIA